MVKKRRLKKGKKVNLKRWLILFSLIFLCFFTGKLIFSFRKSIWKKGRFNFVFVSQPVLVLSLSPKEDTLTVVKIPQKTYVEVTRSFGLYKIESVYPLGELEGKGGPLLAETAQEFLGVPVEGYLRIRSRLKAQGSRLDKEEILSLKRKITSWGVFLRPQKLLQFLKQDLETNLTFWDLAKIWLNVKRVSSGKINFIDLEKAAVLKEFSLPDGQIGKKGDPLLIDNLLQDFFFDLEIRKEKISIEVLNGTDCPGLAQRAARIISNIGGKVTEVQNSKKKIDKSQLIGGEKAFRSFTFFKIKEIFNCQVLKEEKDGMVVIVGGDYEKKLFSKE